jgi:hypothetical protein
MIFKISRKYILIKISEPSFSFLLFPCFFLHLNALLHDQIDPLLNQKFVHSSNIDAR